MKTIVILLMSLLAAVLFSEQALATGQVIGNVDGFYSDANGNPVISGWTCQVGNPNPIQVDLYLNQPYSSVPSSSGLFINRYTANTPSEPAVASACGTNGTNYRFAVTLPSSQFLAGDPIYAYGIISTGGTQISTTSKFTIPANSLATNNPGAVGTGAQLIVYDTMNDSSASCSPLLDIPLYPVASPGSGGVSISFPALSDNGKNVDYFVTGQINSVGSETQPFHVNCNPVLVSGQDPLSGNFNGNQWLAGFFKDASGNVFSLVHNEYYGGNYPNSSFEISSSANCSLGQPYGVLINAYDCTYAAIDIAEMPSGSSTFQLVGSAPPSQVVARPSFAYMPVNYVPTSSTGPTGYFTNTNAFLNSDGYYYAMTVDILPSGEQRRCPIRTSNISDPSSWKGWDGSDFTINLSAGADCADDNVLSGIFPFYLGYSTYFQKAIMVGAISSDSGNSNAPAMIAYSLSSDFIHWSQPMSFAVPIFTPVNGPGWGANNYASLLDVAAIQNSQMPNWSTGAVVGQGPWLVFRQQYTCNGASDPNCPAAGKPPRTRFVAVPVGFSK